MEIGKCHLFFRCRIMKLLLSLLFLFLLLDNPQGSAISHKRSIRALNTTLQTNFNGTYERINPCSNAKIESNSYVASHEFHHHTQANDWNNYTRKFSSIISSFLKALGNLIHFNHKQNGIFNFHINTSIIQKQDGYCNTGKRTSCNTLPTITIEATDCEISPGLPCGNLPDGGQLFKNENRVSQKGKESFSKGSKSESQTTAETSSVTSNFNKDSALNKSQCRIGDEITSVSFLDVTADEGRSKLQEGEKPLILDDIFLPATKMGIPSESEFLVAGALMETENFSRAANDPSENVRPTHQTEKNPDTFRPSVRLASQLDPENYVSSQKTEPETFADSEKLKAKSSESFNELDPSHPYYLPQTSYFGVETTPEPVEITDNEEPFYSNQPSDLLFKGQGPNAYSKQLFDDNLDGQVPDSRLNQEPDNSFFFPDEVPAETLTPQELLPTIMQKPENPILRGVLEVYPFSLEKQSPGAVKQNEELFQQFLESGNESDSFDKTQMLPNTDIFSETETDTSSPSQTVISEEVPPDQIANSRSLQISDLIRDDNQTPALEFSKSYPLPSAEVPPIKNSREFTLMDYNSYETAKEKAPAADYSDELFEKQSAFGSSLGGSTSIVTFSPDIDQGISSSDKLSIFNIRKPLTDLPTQTTNEYSLIENTFDDANENQFLINESPVLTSESQKSVNYRPQENLEEYSTDFITEDESLSSDQFQSALKPVSQSLLNYPDQYENVEDGKQLPENTSNPDSELTINEPSYSVAPENQSFFERISSSPQNQTVSNSDQELIPFASDYDSSTDFESFPPSGEGDEYLTKLPPEQDSLENSQQIPVTFDPYQNPPNFSKTPFPSAPEGKLALSFPGQVLSDEVATSIPDDPSTLNSEQSSIDVYTSRSPETASFDDYQDSSYSETKIEASLTTPVQYFNNDNTYDSTKKPYFTDARETHSKGTRPTISTIFGADELEKQSSSYSNQSPHDTLGESLSYNSDNEQSAQNYDTFKLQPNQFLQQREESLSEPFLNQRYFSTKSSKAENYMSYDSEIQPLSFVPQAEQYSSGNVFISGEFKQNPASVPYFDEGFSQENQTISSPQSLMPYNNEGFFPSFKATETTLTPDFSDSDDYFEPVTANGYQKSDFQTEFSNDFDARPGNYSFDSLTTPLPPLRFQSEDFSLPSNYETVSENPLTQTQVQGSSTSLDEPLAGENLPRELEERASSLLVPTGDVSKFGLGFQTPKDLNQPSELAATVKATSQLKIPIYEDQSDQAFSYVDAPESLVSFARKQVSASDQSKIQTQNVFFPEQKSFLDTKTTFPSKPPMNELPENDSPTSPEYQPTAELAGTETYESNSDNLEKLPGADQQPGEIFDQESTPNHSERFYGSIPNSRSKESSADFFPSTELALNQNISDSPKEETEYYLKSQRIQSSPDIFDPQPLISMTGNDQPSSLEFQYSSVPESQLESSPSFSNDKTLSDFSDQSSLSIPSQTNPSALTENQELQSDDFQISDSSVITPYTNYPLQDTPENSQSIASLADIDSSVSNEYQLTKPDSNKEMNSTPNQQTEASFNGFEPPQPELETHNQFLPISSLQPTESKQTYDKKLALNNDYSSFLNTSPQIPPVYECSNQVPSSYSGTNFASQPETYEFPLTSPQTLLDEYSEITPTAEREIPFDVDETNPSMLKISSPYINEQTEEPQYVQEEIPDSSTSLATQPQQKPQPQPSFDYLNDVPGEEMAERAILPTLEIRNFSEKKPERFIANDSTPPFTGTNASTDYNQDNEPTPKESDYSDTNFNIPVPALNNPNKDQKFSITSPPFHSVLSMQSNSDWIPQPSPFTFQQLNNSQKDTGIPPRYLSKEQLEQDISVITDKVSPRFRPVTAGNHDEKITESSPKTKPQPQMSLNFVQKLSDDNIQEQLTDPSNQRYQVTSDAALSPKFEPGPLVDFPSVSVQRETQNFDSDARQSQTWMDEEDQMRDFLDQTQNDFDPNLPSRIPDFSSQVEPPALNPERFRKNQEQLSSYNRYKSLPIVKSDRQQISFDYPQNSPTDPAFYDRFSSDIPPRERKYFSEPFPFPQEQRLTSSNFGEHSSGPKERIPLKITQQGYRNTFDVPSINIDNYQTPVAVSRHSAQKAEPQIYPENIPNQHFTYNVGADSDDPVNNFYNSKPESQTEKASSGYSASYDDPQSEGSLERPLPFNSVPYTRNPEFERSVYQTMENADSPTYNDYDEVLSSQLTNEKLLEYDEDTVPNLDVGNSEMVRPYQKQSSDTTEEEPRESSSVFQTDAESILGFNEESVPFDFQDGSSPDNESPSFPSPPVQKEPHSNPLLQTLEHQLTFPFYEHLSPSASSSSFSDPEKESLNDAFSVDQQNQNEFRDSSEVSHYTERGDSELDFINNQRSEPINGVETAQGVMNTSQPDSRVLVSDLNIPSSKSGEDCVEYCGKNPTHLLCPFDSSILKGNMTAPSYYILVSKLPVVNDEEERFKVEKVYLGDGIPLNCTLSAGKTFPTSLYTPIPFSPAGTVQLRTNSDFA